MSRERFEALYAQYRVLLDGPSLLLQGGAEEDDAREAYGRLLLAGKRKVSREAAISAACREETWVLRLIGKPIVDRYWLLIREEFAERNWLDYQLDQLAKVAEVRSGEFRDVESVSSSTYSNQTQPLEYARGSAEITAAMFARHGVETRVQERDRRNGDAFTRSWTLATYVVQAAIASDVDAEILRRKPGFTLREWVAACWARCLNPRVYNPWLPYGIEQKLGVDYQGRYTDRKSA